jgi:hypothetical protein
MSREQIGRLITAVQSRATPPERLPSYPTEDTAAPVGTRPPAPDWLPDELKRVSFDVIPLEPDDEITIEEDGATSEGIALPDSGNPKQINEQVPSFDALAHYLPFHFYKNRWGIYLSESGILEVTRTVVGGDRISWRDRWCVGFAAKALFLHEFFHHAVEVACSRLEFPLLSPHYNSYFTNPAAADGEESIANAYLARNIRRYYSEIPPRPLRKAYWNLRSFMDRQPGPYAEYRDFVRDEDYSIGRDKLITEMYSPVLNNSRPGYILGAGMYFANVTPVASEYPLYLVLDHGESHLRVARPFPKELGLQVFVYSNDHTPPHIHVRDLDGDLNTRYLWPSLTSYPDDPRLPRRKENSLKAYVARYSQGLIARIAAVYGAPA